MDEFVAVSRNDDITDIVFYIENEEIMEIGDKLNEINEEAYMNGENWSILLEAWLTENEPDLLEGLDPDPEAGMYAAYYHDTSDETLKKAERFAAVIKDFVSDPEKLYDFVRENGEDIEWD